MYLSFTENPIILVVGIAVAFALTIGLLKALAPKMPHDQGRAFAVEGALSMGKVRGCGLIFVLVFAFCDILFNSFNAEKTIYLIVLVLCMFSGYFDDASEKPWNEYLKGALDLILSIIIAVTYLFYNGNSFEIAIVNKSFEVPYILYGILIVALVWVAINVTNCTDGVDGLSATLSIITLGSFWFIMRDTQKAGGYTYTILLFITVLIAYLWYNANPSTMLMGDAGSRAMGMLIAISALMSHKPFVYLVFSVVMIVDGGLGLLKVSVIRFLRIKTFMRSIRCPLHDHARKVNSWSNTQVVFRFAIIQMMISMIYIFLYECI